MSGTVLPFGHAVIPADKVAVHHGHAKSHPLRRWLRVVLFGFVTIGCLLAVLQIGVNLGFANRILPGVTVDGEQIGSLTTSEAQQRLQTKIATVRVQLNLNGNLQILTPAQVGASYDLDTTLAQAMVAGRSNPWAPVELWRSMHLGSLPFSYRLDTSVERAEITRLVAGIGLTPQNATIIIQNGVPSIQADKPGRAIGADMVEAAITSQIGNAGARVVSLRPRIQPARLTAADVATALAETRQLLAVPITITYQTKSFTPTAAQVGAWIGFKPDTNGRVPGLTPQISSDAVGEYLQTIAQQINVAPVARHVNVLSGVSTQTQAGQNGTQLDASSLVTKIVASLGSKQPLTTEAPTTPVAYQTQYNNTVAQPYAQYVEVNLSSQHLWAYQNNQVVYDSPVTSGATGAGFPTATGMFSIQAKQTNRHLIGYAYGPRYNYDVFVQYWMPFFEGYGLHDASWRNGNFGGQDYYYGGSHGCVNLPLATAAWLYNWVSVGTPVWVHN